MPRGRRLRTVHPLTRSQQVGRCSVVPQAGLWYNSSSAGSASATLSACRLREHLACGPYLQTSALRLDLTAGSLKHDFGHGLRVTKTYENSLCDKCS